MYAALAVLLLLFATPVADSHRVIREDAKAEVLHIGAVSGNALASLPVNMLIIDGNASLDDALAAVDQLKKESALPIIVHGVGEGSAVALQVATKRELPGLVLEGAIGNSDAMKEPMSDYRGSVLLVIGEHDRIAPMALSGKLLDDAGVSPWKRLVVSAGKTHGDAMTADVALAAYRELVNYITR